MYKQFREIKKGEFFVVFADTSAGMGDYCAVQFLSKTKIDIPLVYHSPSIATEMTNDIYPVLENIFYITGKKPIVAYERNNGGMFELERLASMNYKNKYEIFTMPKVGNIDNPEPSIIGWTTSTATRPQMLQDLKNAVDNKIVRIYDEPTINELFSFVKVQTTNTIKAQAERGSHDDLVMSAAGAWQMYQICEDINSISIPKDDFSKWSIGSA